MQEQQRPRFIRLIIGPLMGCLAYWLLSTNGLDHAKAATVLVTIWMGIWWITEVIDLGVTSFLPFLLFPLLGVLDANTVAAQYMEQTIFLFVGGFFLAYAMERWNLHQRLAFSIILKAGSTPSRVLLGIMITTFTVSMWISNTATTVMLLAAVLAIVRHEHLFPKSGHAKIATGYLLALAYTASIGGYGHPRRNAAEHDPGRFHGQDRTGRGELQPLVRLRLSVRVDLWHDRVLLHPVPLHSEVRRPALRPQLHPRKLEALGPLQTEEKRVIAIFLFAVLGWFTRIDLDFGAFRIPGWSNLLPEGKMIKDSTIAIFAALLLFLIPAKKKMPALC